MQHVCILLTALFGGLLADTAKADSAVQIVASIKPVHSLVAAVSAGVSEPELIIRGTNSPHTFSLRPSDARSIQNADVIFLVGDALETSLAGSVEALGSDALVVKLADVEGLTRLALREGATFEGHLHGGAEYEDDHGDSHENGDHEASHAPHGNEHYVQGAGAFDMHVWLDPANARFLVRAIASALATADPVNAATFQSNANTVESRLEALIGEIDGKLTTVRDRPFIVFHDAYHYFEDRFRLSAAGSASVSPDRPPGARRISELRHRVRDLNVVCVLTEPQFDPRIAGLIIEGTPARLGSIDPLGATLDSGADMYFALIRNMATAFTDCLVPPEQIE